MRPDELDEIHGKFGQMIENRKSQQHVKTETKGVTHGSD